jgi:hypothetical protein
MRAKRGRDTKGGGARHAGPASEFDPRLDAGPPEGERYGLNGFTKNRISEMSST